MYDSGVIARFYPYAGNLSLANEVIKSYPDYLLAQSKPKPSHDKRKVTVGLADDDSDYS